MLTYPKVRIEVFHFRFDFLCLVFLRLAVASPSPSPALQRRFRGEGRVSCLPQVSEPQSARPLRWRSCGSGADPS